MDDSRQSRLEQEYAKLFNSNVERVDQDKPMVQQYNRFKKSNLNDSEARYIKTTIL